MSKISMTILYTVDGITFDLDQNLDRWSDDPVCCPSLETSVFPAGSVDPCVSFVGYHTKNIQDYHSPWHVVWPNGVFV